MQSTIDQIQKFGVLPVIKIEDAGNAVPLAKALIQGGLPAAEITFRTNAAEEAIREIVSAFPEMLVGAGTVLTPEQARTALNAGAKFIVSPGLNPAVVDFCQDQGVLITPGICTPTELELALSKGLKVVKFFPAGASGGLNFLKSMSAPYGGVQFIPTGGVNAANLLEYLNFNKVLACGGSWMVKADLISAQKFDAISTLVAEAVATILGFRILNIRLKTEASTRTASAQIFQNLFHQPVKMQEQGVQISKILELASLNSAAEIIVGTNFLNRAADFFERKKISILERTDDYIMPDLDLKGLKVIVKVV